VKRAAPNWLLCKGLYVPVHLSSRLAKSRCKSSLICNAILSLNRRSHTESSSDCDDDSPFQHEIVSRCWAASLMRDERRTKGKRSAEAAGRSSLGSPRMTTLKFTVETRSKREDMLSVPCLRLSIGTVGCACPATSVTVSSAIINTGRWLIVFGDVSVDGVADCDEETCATDARD
jgi:hypothetical protein